KLDIEQFSDRWVKSSAANKNDKQFVSEIKLNCESIASEFEEVNKSCEYFNYKKPEIFARFEVLQKDIEDVDVKLNLYHSFEAGLSNFFEMEWIVSRNKLSAIENYISKWEEENPNCGLIMVEKVKEWRDFLSLLKLCRGECFVKTHWNEFLSLLNLDKETTFDGLKLHHLVSKRQLIFANREAIKELNARSVGEMSVRETFNELDSFAATAVFELYDHKTSSDRNVKLIKSWRTVMNQISESILSLQSLKQSEFFSNEFADKRLQWEERLTSLDTIVSTLNSVQRKWTYLEPIYSKNQTQGFSDSSFLNASNNFQDITRIIESDTHIVRLLRISSLESKLRDIDSIFNTCQKKLNVFMEQSRNRFPRFYFLADDDLLLVLAGKVDISQTGLLKKLFNNSISKLKIVDNSVIAIESPEGEVVALNNKVSIESSEGATGVEQWLKSLEVEIKSSLKYLTFNALKSNFTFENASLELPSQTLGLLHFIVFTKRVEDAIKRNKMSEFQNELQRQLEVYTNRDLTNEDNIIKIKVKSLILDFIHYLSVVEELVSNNVENIEDWFWQKHLRYYHDSRNETVEVKMGNSVCIYSFEYLGTYGASKLVHTPLTDKCYLICMQAMSMGLGGNPYGPAGTGKTESIKALGQQLGRQVLVFNCDEAIDIKSILRILIGLIKCGFWGCFDEFNRLQIDVLSSLSSHIQSIQNALKNSMKSVTLFDENIEINSNCGIFVTLNPVGKQYKGRNRLPDNLKALFLPISMTIPDSAIISKVLLLSEGFDLSSSKEIGEKITSWFELCKFSMSQQKHYDWGLRAIKSCLLSSGRTLKTNKDMKQTLAVMTALRKQIKSKLVQQDEEKFEELIRDVFSDKLMLNSIDETADDSRSQVVEIFEKCNLVADETQVSKLFELDEQLKSRLGVVILGETGVGKTTLWKTLIEVKRVAENVTIMPIVINPKSVSRTQLLGFVDDDSREWVDGIFAARARDVSRDDSNNFFWIIFDGDIDPEWVEALNSVLDDNKVLTLPSGERIDFDSQKVNILFETNSLKFASPATISRLGVVSVGNIKTQHLVKSKFKEWEIDHSVDAVLKKISGIKSDLQISYSKTLLSRIKFAVAHNKNVDDVLNEKSNYKKIEPYKLGKLVVTSSVQRVIDLVSSLSDESLILIGDSGVGKHSILTETILKTGFVVAVNSYPKITARDITLKLRETCVLMNLGSQKVLKTSNGSKLIIYVRHVELIEADKWQSKYLLAFLTNLISYKGYYDEESLEWISVDNFQVIATCVSSEYVDSKLFSLLHIINVDLPESDELNAIFEQCCPDNEKWKSTFANGFSKVVNSLKDSNSKYDFLRIANKIIKLTCRHSEVNEESICHETYRNLKYVVDDTSTLERSLLSSFGTAVDKDNSYFCEAFGSKLSKRKKEEFCSFFHKALNIWINDTEINITKIGLIQECIDLFSEVCTFLSDSEQGVKGLILSASSGTGRMLATK
ncbi:cytoplasmic dynein 2 heavy chain 1-like protein 3, partial [Leptotrombidium deliense]